MPRKLTNRGSSSQENPLAISLRCESFWFFRFFTFLLFLFILSLGTFTSLIVHNLKVPYVGYLGAYRVR